MLLGLGRATPNQIDTISVPGYVGAIGMVACPGVRVNAGSAGVKRHYQADLQEITDWGANSVVSLVEDHELKMHKIEEMPEYLASSGIQWYHLPIMDMNIPDQQFEDNWAFEGERIRHSLRIGERIILHCYAGLGRTGMIAARLLVELGVDPDDAIRLVRRDNRRRIQTKDQLAFVHTCYQLD